MTFVFGTSSGYQAFADQLLALVTGQSIKSLTVDAAGTGYVVGDEVAVSGGVSTIQGVADVTAVGGAGEVTAVRVRNAGLYTTTPGAGAPTTGGTGTGLTLNVTINNNGWTMKRDTNVGGSGQREVIVEGVGTGGTDEILVGWRTFADAGTGARNLELAGFTGFDGGLSWAVQPGVSPGRHETTGGGAFVPLTEGTIIWWVNVTPRRILIATRVGAHYGSAYIGLIDPFATGGEWPYPLAVIGTTFDRFTLPTSNTQANAGIILCVGGTSAQLGPGFVRLADGQWEQVKNTQFTSLKNDGVLMYPTGGSTAAAAPDDDKWFSAAFAASGTFMPFTLTLGGTAPVRLFPTPGTSDKFTLIPATLHQYATEPSGLPISILGQLAGVFWMNAAGSVLNENRLEVNGQAYTAFQSGAHTAEWARWAMREDG